MTDKSLIFRRGYSVCFGAQSSINLSFGLLVRRNEGFKRDDASGALPGADDISPSSQANSQRAR